jgi:uncharacterized membrane protein YhaH (DUF805 family)
MLGRLIGGFITILVGVSILPTVANEVKSATNNANVTGATSTVTDLVTLFFALGVMAAGISVAVGGLRDAGLM